MYAGTPIESKSKVLGVLLERLKLAANLKFIKKRRSVLLPSYIPKPPAYHLVTLMSAPETKNYLANAAIAVNRGGG